MQKRDNQLAPEAMFCTNCGAKIEQTPAHEAPPTPPPSQPQHIRVVMPVKVSHTGGNIAIAFVIVVIMLAIGL